VPPKVPVFWWRVVNGYLPTRGVLHHRHIEPTANCEVCGEEVESIKHALLDCTVAKAFWAQVRMMTGVKVPQLHPVTWARDLVDPDVFPAKSVAVVLCGMWSLWMSRNKKRHGERDVPVKFAVQWAIDTAFDLWQILHPAKPAAAMANTQRSWQKPPPGWFKCNVDASFHAGNRNAASGVVLRDENGRTCGGKAVWYDHCLNALMAEAMACRDGLIFARTRGVRKLQLETDCQVLVNLWTNRTSQKSEINPILQQMEDLSRSFEAFDLVFINRKCNRFAHECARLVSRDNPVEEWLITPPGLRDIFF